MTESNKQMAQEFVFDLQQSAREMGQEAFKALGTEYQKQNWNVLIDVVDHSLLVLKTHLDQWVVSEKSMQLILNAVVELTDAICEITKEKEKLQAVNLPATEISLRIHSVFAGGALSW